MSFIRNISIISLCLLALVGCGGGASDSSGALTLAVTAPADTTQPGTATAKYTAADGRNPMGLEISFSTDRPDLVALDASSRSVGSDGNAAVTFLVTAVQDTTTVRIIASSGDLSTFQTLTLQGDAGAPPPTPPATTLVPTQVQVLSMTPADGKLALKGTGTPARPENGFVSFKVVDSNSSSAVPNVIVDFTVSPVNNGGVALSPTFGTTNSSGVVTVAVSSGATQAALQLTATVRQYPTLQATAQLSVTAGPPDQDSFSLSAVTLNNDGFNYDGVMVPINVRLADHFNNPPPAGTVVLFETNGGKVYGPGITDASGNVTVQWESQAPRPENGKFTILAYAVGEESFTDYDGDGLADAGEFTDTGYPYLDANWSGSYNAGAEQYYPDVNGAEYSGGDTKYNGIYQSAAFVGAPTSKFIFKNINLIMCTDEADITTDLEDPITGPVTFHVTVKDGNGNTMAAGTTISVKTDNGKISSPTATYTVPNNVGSGYTFSVVLSSDGTASAGGAITITVTSSRLETILAIPITGGV